MAKKAKVRMTPKTLNESTLETNIVGEISALFRFPDRISYPSRLGWYLDVLRHTTPSQGKRVKMYRLTPFEEYEGGGWDSRIDIPAGNGTQRAVFIQFKAGKHSEGNEIPGSIFNIEHRNPNKHVAFTFNDNSDNTQHETLKNLRDECVKLGLPSKSVLYGFPRITDLDDFEKLEDDLLMHTTFLSLSEMDSNAKSKGVNLYDRQEHHFRTCYFDETRREISSKPFTMVPPEVPSSFLYEILLVHYARWRNQFPEELSIESLNEEYYLFLADFLKINPFELHEFRHFPRFPPSIERELKIYYKEVENQNLQIIKEIFGVGGNQQRLVEWRKDIFIKVVQFATKKERREISISNDVPNIHSFTLKQQISLDIEMKQGDVVNLLVF
jgi:hypothetical protein